jgi:uncharacterized protein YdbL (DUF1318 family)
MIFIQRLAMILLLLGGLAAGGANADQLDDAKARGEIGERIDGYVGLFRGGAETEALVEEVNAGRRAKYAEVAGKRSAPVAAVAQIAGKKLIERAPAGSYVMGADGTWRQK